MDKLTARRLAYKQSTIRRAALGLCMSCDTPAVPNGQKCETHRNTHRRAQKTMKDRRTLRGLCAKCGRVPVSRFRRCGPCRALEADYKRAVYARRSVVA